MMKKTATGALFPESAVTPRSFDIAQLPRNTVARMVQKMRFSGRSNAAQPKTKPQRNDAMTNPEPSLTFRIKLANTDAHKTNRVNESDRVKILMSSKQSAGMVTANTEEARAILLRTFSFSNVKYKTQAAAISKADCRQTVTYAAETGRADCREIV